MIIINKSDNILEIIEKIEKFNEINKNLFKFSSKVEKKIHKKFLKNKDKNFINLYLPENHDLLKTLSLLKMLVEKFDKQKIIIHSKWVISEENIKFSKINFISFRETFFQKFQKTKFYKNKILFFGLIFFSIIILLLTIIFIKNIIFWNNYINWKEYSWEIDISFSETPSKKDVLLNPLITYTQLNKDFLVTSLNFNSAKRASWIIEIKNFENRDFKIKAKTQFITEDNIIFENIDDIVVKKAIHNSISPKGIEEEHREEEEIEPTTTNIFVIAKTHTKAGIFIWERWNIKKDTKLKIKKLEKYKLNFTAKSNFIWWNNDITSTLSKENFNNFKKIYTKKIIEKAVYELSEITKFKAKEDSKKYIFINNIETIKFEKINIENIFLDGENPSNIILVWNIKAKWFFYNEKEILGKIKEKIDNKNIVDIRIIEEEIILKKINEKLITTENNKNPINQHNDFSFLLKKIKFSYKIKDNE